MGQPLPRILPTAVTSLSNFRACTEDEVREVIMRSPSKSCSLDPIPTTILKECIDDLLPFLTAMCNASLLEGHLPVSQRHAIITPLIKKPHLDATDVKNYRPVSNLTFVSKVVERLISGRLVSYLQENDLMPVEQSAYRKNHSTETALLRVISDLLNSMDKQEVTLLGLLDLSAAFDCVDHDILLSRLERTFGIDGLALEWIRSFLADRTQQVAFRGQLSGILRLVFGVPQGSVLGPLLFLLYTAELLDIIKNEGLKAHSYADDTQVHVSTGAADVGTAVQRFVSCTERIESWMSSNRLKMNAEKTQVIWIGSRQQLAKVDIKEFQLLSANILFSTTVSNLGVHLDSQLTMQDHVAAMCRSCFFQLRQLRTIRSSLTTDAAKTLAQAFVGGRLDYCNSLLYGVSEELLRRLQSIQNGGGTVYHWYSAIRSHYASVAQPSLVASATKDNFQDRHSDVPVFEWTGTFLSGSRLHRNFCDTRPETVAICHLRAAVHSKNQDNDIWTKVIQGLWSNNLERSSRQDERSIFEHRLISKIAKNILV